MAPADAVTGPGDYCDLVLKKSGHLILQYAPMRAHDHCHENCICDLVCGSRGNFEPEHSARWPGEDPAMPVIDVDCHFDVALGAEEHPHQPAEMMLAGMVYGDPLPDR